MVLTFLVRRFYRWMVQFCNAPGLLLFQSDTNLKSIEFGALILVYTSEVLAVLAIRFGHLVVRTHGSRKVL